MSYPGLGVLPWTLNAELSPSPSRPLSSSLAASFNWACAFAVTWVGPWAEDGGGGKSASILYFSFSACSAAGAAFVAKKLPETKGKSEGEIQEMFEDVGEDREEGEDSVGDSLVEKEDIPA